MSVIDIDRDNPGSREAVFDHFEEVRRARGTVVRFMLYCVDIQQEQPVMLDLPEHPDLPSVNERLEHALHAFDVLAGEAQMFPLTTRTYERDITLDQFAAVHEMLAAHVTVQE